MFTCSHTLSPPHTISMIFSMSRGEKVCLVWHPHSQPLDWVGPKSNVPYNIVTPPVSLLLNTMGRSLYFRLSSSSSSRVKPSLSVLQRARNFVNKIVKPHPV